MKCLKSSGRLSETEIVVLDERDFDKAIYLIERARRRYRDRWR